MISDHCYQIRALVARHAPFPGRSRNLENYHFLTENGTFPNRPPVVQGDPGHVYGPGNDRYDGRRPPDGRSMAFEDGRAPALIQQWEGAAVVRTRK